MKSLHDQQAEFNIQQISARLQTAHIPISDVQDAQTPKQRLTRLFRVADALKAAVAHNCACQKGCSHCCYQAVTISSEEAKRIEQSTHHKAVIPAGEGIDPFQIERDQQMYKGNRCPFLVGKECAIYDVRPLACRLHFNISNDPTLCDTVGHPGALVPHPDFTNIHILSLQALEGALWQDIRLFFPEKKHDKHEKTASQG